ncbi:MAG: undecaprenyl diphosphate synthase family protein [Nanoarchaeota archaeon]
MIDKVLRFGKEVAMERSRLPKHIALVIGGNELYAASHNIGLDQAYQKSFEHFKAIHEMTLGLNIPLFSAMLLSERMRDSPNLPTFVEKLIPFLDQLADSPLIHKHQVKVSVFGKWYKLPDQLVESVKNLIEKTRDYDRFFLNLCLNYDGQEEIVDACKLVGKQISMGRLDPDLITRQVIKENLYTSSFLPVSLLIITGPQRSFQGLLLWDSKDAMMYYARKRWLEFTRNDFLEALGYHQSI